LSIDGNDCYIWDTGRSLKNGLILKVSYDTFKTVRGESKLYMKRPSHREISAKIKAAKEAIERGKFSPADFKKAAADLEKLDLWGKEEMRKTFFESLTEITPNDYEGQRPPAKSMEKKVFNEEMFAFCWDSKRFLKRMYLKFCMKQGHFYYISFHETKYR
jgi:hypothetical protein